jgi:hypothetical protein
VGRIQLAYIYDQVVWVQQPEQSQRNESKIMEWYGPLTILPAIALVILSTSNFIVSSNSEIQALE